MCVFIIVTQCLLHKGCSNPNAYIPFKETQLNGECIYWD